MMRTMRRLVVVLLAVFVLITAWYINRPWFAAEVEVYEAGVTGNLAGRPVRGLYASYLGLATEEVVPENLQVDWVTRLESLWELKHRRYPNRPTARRASRELLAEYSEGPPTRLTFDEYMSIADREACLMHQSIDWAEVGRLRLYNHEKQQVNERKLALLRQIAGEIAGRELIAYALTELMPGDNGQFNRDFLCFLLRNAGREFVEGIPAMGDNLTSFGPFQWTQYAVYDADERRGASVMNQALSADLRIPGSVIKLRGNDHFRAAWLFAIENLATLIRYLDDKELAALELIWRERMTEIVEFIAVSHHAPAPSRRFAQTWLSAGAEKEFASYCEGRFVAYAYKSRRNYEALAGSETLWQRFLNRFFAALAFEPGPFSFSN